MNKSNGDNKMKLTCPACQQRWSVPLPQVEVANNLRCSVVTVAHENLIRCINNRCRQPFMVTIGGCQVAFQVHPVGDEIVQQMEGTTIIKPTLGLVQ